MILVHEMSDKIIHQQLQLIDAHLTCKL